MPEQNTASRRYQIYNDIPIKDAKHFNFEAYTDALSKIILNKENSTPFTIAINGKWGSGKTTLMKTLRAKLDSESGKENNRKVKSVWFDAWKYSETDSMLAALVFEIFEEMGRQGRIDSIKARILGGREINLFNEFTDLIKVLTAGQVELDKWLENPAYKQKLSFYDLFQDYMKKILITFILEKKDGEYSDEEGVLVIFIDDLDRCPPKNVAKVLESINLFFEQEGCFFIIGTDISLISKAIELEYRDLEGFSGKDYIKKMIQLQFNLPAIGEDDIKTFMEDELKIDETLKEYFYMISKGLESNQREIKRFLNSLNLMKILSGSIKNLVYEEELLIKWSILNFSSEPFIKEVNNYPELMIMMQEISRKKKEEIDEYIETLDEQYKDLCNRFKENEKIHNVLKSGKKEYSESDIKNYIFLSSVAPKEPGEIKEVKSSLLNELLTKDVVKRKLAGDKYSSMPDPDKHRFLRDVSLKLKDEDVSERVKAAEVLGRIGDERAVDALTGALEDQNEPVRLKAAEALSRIGSHRAIDAVTQTLKTDTSASVRSNAAKALGRIGDERAVEILIDSLKVDNSASVRLNAAEVLGNMVLRRIGDERAVDALILALKDEEASVRSNIAKALGHIGDARAVEPLIEVLKDKDRYVRLNAIEALGRMPDIKAFDILLDIWRKDEDDEVRNAAWSVVEKIKA